MVNIPKSLQSQTSSVTVGQQKKIKKYGSLENYDRYQSESKRIAGLNESAKKEAQAAYDKQLAEYNAQVKTYEAQVAAQNNEIAEWKQAEKLAGKIQLGQGGRWDRKSSVGKKISYFLNTWSKEVRQLTLVKLCTKHQLLRLEE